MRRSTLLLASLGLLPGLLVGCARRAGGGGEEESFGPLAAELDISRVTINQGVEIELMDDGDEGDRNGPVISGRDGLVRIYVERQSGWENRKIRGVLTLLNGDEVVDTFDRERTVDSDSHEGDVDSTINIKVDGDDLEAGLDFQVSIHEVDGGTGDVGRARWPSEGGEDLDAENAGGPLRVMLVPIQYNADGSNRVPDTSDTQIDYYRDWITRLYPTHELDFEVEDAVAWGYAISPWGEGWGDLLNYMINYRQSQGYGDDVYVYGVFDPASSFAGYCYEGCILGLSLLVNSASESWMRVSIGVGFFGEESALTLAHEVGHAHGREHAPCGVDDPDLNYPYDDARLGVAGWDIIDEELIEDDHAFDIMSYCDPSWISDYNYEALYERMQDVSAMARMTGVEPSSWSKALVDADGNLRPADGKVRVVLPPQGEIRQADLLNADGELLDRVEARFYPFSHLGGGLLLYPEPGHGVSSLRVDGTSLDL